MFKRIIITTLCLLMIFSIANAETFQWMFEGKISAGQEHSLTAPFAGKIKYLEIQANMGKKEGETIFEMEPDIAYAPIDGTVGVVLAKPGDNLASVKELYKGALFINTKTSGTIKCTYLHNSRPYEFSVAQLGETVYIRNRSDESQMGVGEVIARDSKGYTVRITEGELRFNSKVYIFRTPDFSAYKRLGSGTISRTDAVPVNADGTLIKMLCKKGDTVSAGDPIFLFTKGGYNGEDTVVKMPQNGIITKIEKKMGENVDKDTNIAIYILDNEKFVSAKLNEMEVNKLNVGDKITAVVDSLNLKDIKCTIKSISSIPDDKGLYEVIISSDEIKDFRIGTTLAFSVK